MISKPSVPAIPLADGMRFLSMRATMSSQVCWNSASTLAKYSLAHDVCCCCLACFVACNLFPVSLLSQLHTELPLEPSQPSRSQPSSHVFLRNPSLQSTWTLQRSVTFCCTLCFCHTLFQLGIYLFLNFNFLLNLDLVFSCSLGNLPLLLCYHALRTFSILVSRHRSNFFFRDIVLLVRLGLQFALLLLFFVFACCWPCSSRLLLAMLFRSLTRLCRFDQLSEIFLDLLLVVVQVLRLCAPSRQSAFASFVVFFSPLTLPSVVLSLFSVFWRHLLQNYIVVVDCSKVRLKHLQCHYSAFRHFVIIGSR